MESSTLEVTGDQHDALDRLRAAIAAGDQIEAQARARQLLEEDADDLLIGLEPVELGRLFDVLGDEELGALISRLHDADAADVLERLTADQAADLLEEIDPDDATDIFSRVEPQFTEGILVAMEPAEAAELRELLAYPPDSAGGLMTPAFVAIAPDLRADEAIVALRRVAEEAETISYVYVVDAADHLLGVLSLHRLVLGRPDAPISELMYTEIMSVRVDTDQEEAARYLRDRNLLALPVVDHENRILGIITADDVHEVLEEETTEDIERLGGSAPLDEPYLRASPLLLFQKRIVWLLVLFAAQFVTLQIYDYYESMGRELILLNLFVPILIGTGGNVGSQTVTTIIRALALGEARPRHFLRIIGKEAMTGLALGAVMGVLMFARGAWKGGVEFGLTVGITVAVLIVWAALIGAVLPMIFTKMRVDPAVISAPFITSLIDGTGLIIYFTLAGLILHVGS